MKRYCPSKRKWKAERRLAKFDRSVKRQQHESGNRMFLRKIEMDARAQAIWARKFAEELSQKLSITTIASGDVKFLE